MRIVYSMIQGNKGQKSGRYNQSGFTLLELIVSMTILSLVTVLIGSGFRLALDSWEKGETETEWTQRLRVLSMLLTQQLKSAYPYKVDDGNEKVVLFEGESDSMLFVTSLADLNYGGFKWVRYSYKNETLLYNEGLLPDKELDDVIKKNEEVIDENLEELMFEYYSRESSEWMESWSQGEELPGAVRIKISNFQPFSIYIPIYRKDKREFEAIENSSNET